MTTRAARRVGGTTKLVPCTTSAGPTNHSDGRTPEMGPGQVQWTGGHGPLADVDAYGHERWKATTSAPGDGEGVHIELGDRRQRTERPLAESTHPGSGAEQRRGVHRHPEAFAGRVALSPALVEPYTRGDWSLPPTISLAP